MTYLIILAAIIVISLILKISSNYLFLLAGLLIILHPVLIAKEQILAAYRLSIFVFLLFLAALIITAIKNLLPFKIDEQDSFIVKSIKNSLKITGVRVGNNYIKKKYMSIILAIIFVFLIWWVGLTAAFLGLLFLAFIANKWDSRVMAAFALGCLLTCPILLIFKNAALAESLAIYAYYFLALTVLLQIIEYKRENKFSDQEIDNQKNN